MNIYYIDYENVSSQGLKGVESLGENDEVVLLYSKKADHVKIDILTTLMTSKAKIRFLPVHVGTPNALDFQLVTLLFLNYRDEDFCYIISKDSGYDCCIKTAAQNGAPNVARYPNIESAVNKTPLRKKNQGKRNSKNDDSDAGLSKAPACEDKTAEQPETSMPQKAAEPSQSASPVYEPQPEQVTVSSEESGKKKTARRRGRKKTAPETEAVQPDDASKRPAPEKEKEQNQNKEQNGSQGKEQNRDHSKDQNKEQVQATAPAPERLQQRYLSKQFDSRTQPSAAGGKSDDSRPVSILSLIRRRNDVQLDMHQIDLIRDALKNSNNKQQFYSYFVKKLGQKQGIELYHSVKSSYTDLVNANLI